MTITFENDNDVIVYALEMITYYARNNQYIFLAQSVWWISSIIGLQSELVTHIDNLRRRKVQNTEIGLENADKALRPDNEQKESCGRAVSNIPRDLQEEPRNKLDFPAVHLDRISQINNSAVTDSLDKVLEKAEEVPKQAQPLRKRFDPLQRTNQGKLLPRKLVKKEPKQLNRIIQESPDLVREFIN
jgi:hypothetical protein